MKTLTVKFKYRNVGDHTKTSVIDRVGVEIDSTPDEIDKQINYHFKKWHDNTYIVHVYPYEILN